jgi:transposase
VSLPPPCGRSQPFTPSRVISDNSLTRSNSGQTIELGTCPAEKPDITLRALAAELSERGIKVSYFAVWHFFEHEGISFKKSLYASEQDRPDVARRRAQWKKYQGRLDPSRLVFIDETLGQGRAPKGEGLIAKVPHGRWRTLTFLAALRCDRIAAPCFIDGPIVGESFLAYVEQVLLPALKPGDIVIIDNLGSHKGKAVRRAIRAAGAKLFFLPPYSPDLNPIEQVFAKLKTLRPCSVRPPNELSRQHGSASAPCFPASHQRNAPTTSPTQDTLQNEPIML